MIDDLAGRRLEVDLLVRELGNWRTANTSGPAYQGLADGLRMLGGHIRATPDGFTVRGVPSRIRGGGTFDSRGDHRIAMLGAVTGLVSREGVEVEGAASAAVSFPGFYDLLDSLRATTS